MGVFSDDFAAVDFREDYANLSLPKEAKFKRCNERQKPIKESIARRKKRQPIPSGLAGTAPRRALSVWFSVLFLLSFSWRVLGCGARQRGALVIDKHTPQCQLNKFCGLKQNDNYLKNFNYSL